MGRKTLYRSEFHPAEAKRLAETGMTDREISAALGIGEKTLNEWKNRFPQFRQSIAEGKRKPDLLVEAAMIKRALGTKVREVIYRPSKVPGEPAVAVRIVEREIPPNVRSIEFWLCNRMKGRWSRRPGLEIAAGPVLRKKASPEKAARLGELLKRFDAEIAARATEGGG